nr:PD-(D/E)XK nuclease family protein [Pseudomonadota bacterium]
AQGLPRAATVSIERAIEIAGECVRNALNAALPCGVRLCEIAQPQRRAELEFHLRLAPTRVDELFTLLHAHGYQRGRNGVGAERLNGLLTGVIDMVFEHAGRYHLIDYKTNLLSAYDAESLRAAIVNHDYDLQYLLYTLALHRWLRQTMQGYDYATHLGEVYYLFVRGIVLAPDEFPPDLPGRAESGAGPDSASPHRAQTAEARPMCGEPSMARNTGSHGIHRDRPARELIEAMDALFDAHDETPS